MGTTVRMKLPNGERAASEQIWNTSLGGVFIAMANPLAFGVELSLEFSLVNPMRVLRCRGFVVWSTKSSPEKGGGHHGIGVRLMDLKIGDMRQLSESIGRDL